MSATRWRDPLLLVLAGVLAGVVIVAVHQLRPGLYVICAALGVGALLRAVLREGHLGLLVVRRREVDVVVLAALAIAVGVLAAVTPLSHG